MIKIRNDCVGCPKETGCIGSSCPYQQIPVLKCDDCGYEVSELYDYKGEQLCRECLLDRFDLIDEQKAYDIYDRGGLDV